jgi:cytochrome c-type biogenesis protein CcmF
MNIGVTSTTLTFVLMLVSLFFYIYAEWKDRSQLRVARGAFIAAGLLIVFQSIYLYYGIFAHKFEWDYVYSYTSTELSTFYLISTFWAGQEGTFLLWLLLGSAYGLEVMRRRDRFEPVVMIFVIFVQAFILYILIQSNPFTYLWEVFPDSLRPGEAPVEGRGLNPLLQDPWMIIHPPILFVGYSAAVLLFAYAMAGLYYRQYGEWVQRVYPYAVFTTLFLGTGIILGGYWAYTTLGWGGYWAWDPVENSSLIPWIVSIAFLHTALIQRRQGALIRTNIVLAIIIFVLVLWGSFLTRSGVLADFSVHSFANEGLNPYLITFVLFFLLSGLFGFAYRFTDMQGKSLGSDLLNRGNLMLYGVMALMISAVLTLLGTNAPLISGLFYDNPSAITADFYNMVHGPIAILISLTLALASYYTWRSEQPGFRQLLIHGVISAILTALIAVFALSDAVSVTIIFFSILTITINAQSGLRLLRNRNLEYGGYFAHIGFGLMVIGILTSSLMDATSKANLPKGEAREVMGYEMVYKGFVATTDNRAAAIVNVTLPDGESYDAEMKYYWSEYNRAYMRNPNVFNGLFGDIYIAPIQRYQHKPGAHSRGEMLTLTKNQSKTYGNYNVTFTGYDMGNSSMGAGEMMVRAVVEFQTYKEKFVVRPGMKVVSEERTPLPDGLPSTEKQIFLREINVQGRAVTIEIVDPNADTSAEPSETLAVEVTEKPFIGVLWAGTVLMILGMIVTQVKSSRAKVANEK